MKKLNDHRKRPFEMPVLALALLLSFAPAPLMAQAAPQDEILRKLTREGYARIEVRRTLLGRVRILAEEDGRRREIVVDPSSGEILRDYVSDKERERQEGGLFGWLFGGGDGEGGGSSDDGAHAGSGSQGQGTGGDHDSENAGGSDGPGGGSQGEDGGGDHGGNGDDGGDHGGGGDGGDGGDDHGGHGGKDD